MASVSQDSALSDQDSTKQLVRSNSKRQLVSSMSNKDAESQEKRPLLDKASGHNVPKQEAKPVPAFRAYVGGLSGPRLGFVWITYVPQVDICLLRAYADKLMFPKSTTACTISHTLCVQCWQQRILWLDAFSSALWSHTQT